jgi:hypothetical protein
VHWRQLRLRIRQRRFYIAFRHVGAFIGAYFRYKAQDVYGLADTIATLVGWSVAILLILGWIWNVVTT